MTRSRRLSQREARMWQKVAQSVRKIEKRHEPKIEIEPESETSAPTPLLKKEAIYERPKAAAEDLKKLMESGLVSAPKASKVKAQTKRHLPSHGLSDRRNEKKVRRGKFELGPTLDLHGHTQESAKSALLGFVKFHRSQNEHSLLVITGKGRAGGGILRQRFLDWISEADFRTCIGGYSQAHQKHGGEGAFYIFLRKNKD